MRLRYHAPDEQKSIREPGRLVFPRQALDEARRLAPTHAHRTGEVGAAIEAELDRMQEKLDTLTDDVVNYRFPVLNWDGPPVSAA